MLELNDECINTPDSPGLEIDIYFYSSLLSILGSSAIIITCTFISELRKPPYSFVVFLSLCDFFFSLKYFIFTFEFEWSTSVYGCIFQSAWTQFWGLGSASWNGVIALNVLLSFRNALTQFNYTPIYHLYVWGVCVISSSILFLSGSYGTSFDDLTCWICASKGWAHLLFFGPLFVYFAISIATLFYAIFRVKFILRRRRGEKRVLLRMLFFIIVFLFVWTIPCVHLMLVLDGNPIELLGYIDSLMIGIQGFANAIVWLTSPFFLAQIKRNPLFVKLSLCKRIGEENEEGKSLIDPMSDLHDRMRVNVISAFICGIHSHIKQRKETENTKISTKNGKRANFETEDYEEEIDLSPLSLREEIKECENEEIKAIDVTDFSMKIHAPRVFADLRDRFSISDSFFLEHLNLIEIIKALKKRRFSEGRSGSILIFIPDNPFIIKLISDREAILLMSLLRQYYRHMMKEEERSLLNRYYGLYSIRTPYLPHPSFALILSNLFFHSLPIHRRYDLKGSWVRREVGEKHKSNPDILGMDQDFKHIYKYLNIGRDQRDALLSSVKFDTKFLRKSGIIDYSLLLGIHEIKHRPIDIEEEMISPLGGNENQKTDEGNIPAGGIRSIDGEYIYYLGIIDMLQLYDCNKTTEYCLKVYLQRKDGDGVSVQPPKKYAERFVSYVSEITR